MILDFGKSSGSTVNTLLDKDSTELTKNGFKKTTRTVEGSEMVVSTKAKDKDKGEGQGREKKRVLIPTSPISAASLLRW